jgi:hypothetical protein
LDFGRRTAAGREGFEPGDFGKRRLKPWGFEAKIQTPSGDTLVRQVEHVLVAGVRRRVQAVARRLDPRN